MTSIAAVSRSVFTSKRNSRHMDDYGDGQGHSPRSSNVQKSPERPYEDKIAVPNVSLHNVSHSLEGDSMKYPLFDPDSSNLKLTSSSLSADIQKALLDNSLLGNPIQQSGDGISDKIPAVTASAIEWKTDVFELDVSSRKSAIQSGLIVCDEDDIRRRDTPSNGRSRRPSDERLRTPEEGMANTRQLRKGSEPLLNGSTGKEVVKSRRPLSGLSIKSVKGAFSQRGADAPEVVPLPQQRHQQQQASPHSARNNSNFARPPLSASAASPNRSFASRVPLDPGANRSASYLNAGHTLRPQQSSPALNRYNQQQLPSAVPAPWLTSKSRRPSEVSLRSNTSNINKPLPPEPPGMDLGVSPSPSSTASPALRTPATPGRRYVWHESQPNSPAQSQFLSKDGRSRTAPSNQNLKGGTPKSRYAHLDALDDAFQRSAKASFEQLRQPATAAEMTFRDPLDTIRESPRASQHVEQKGPLQVARGPMKMEPSRRPPPTPKSRGLSPNRDTSRAPSVPSTPRRPSIPTQRIDTSVQTNMNTKNTNNSNVQQPSRTPESRAPASPTAGIRGGNAKLKQILGEETESHQERPRPAPRPAPPQANLTREVFEEPSSMAETSQPMTRSDSITSPYRMGSSDAQFDEIRRRLELLSPTTASDTSFVSTQIVGQMLSNPTSVESPPGQENNKNGAPNGPSPDARPKSMSPVELPAEVNWIPSIQQQQEQQEKDQQQQQQQPQQQQQEQQNERQGGQEVFEMDASESGPPMAETKPTMPFPPPPIPESPKQDVKRTDSKRHSTLSSGTGRTKSLRSVKSARSARSAKARSLNSLAISEIQELYAGLPSPRTTLASRRPSTTAEEIIPELPPMPEVMTTEELEEKDQISADVAEQVLYQILRNLHEPEELFNASLVSTGFYKTFRRHDTKLLRHALWYSSPAAWEYLEMHMPISTETGQLEYPSNVYREQYVRDMRNLSSLKSLILRHCGSILSQATTVLLCANNKRESAPVDDAIWRIWTFCKIFGEDVDRREDLEMQKRWIKGQTMMEAQVQGDHRGKYTIKDYAAFAFGNDEGLTPEELIRMGEIWLCLRKLVKGYQGQREEAREFGIFEGVDVQKTETVREEAILDEWTIHLLSLAPGTNLDVLAPNKATIDNFIKAEQFGFTSWTPPGRSAHGGSGFLTGPICSVLEECLKNDPNMHLHPALRPSALNAPGGNSSGAPSRRTVEGFVSHIRSSQDGREFRKILNAPRPQPTVNTTVPPSQPVALENNVKSAKEGKKSGFGKGKFSIRLPSRSQTQSKSRSKALALPKTPKISTAAPSPNRDGPSSPVSPVHNNNNNSTSRFDLIRNLTQRTRKNSAVKEENRPTNLFANATMAANGRLSPGTEAVNNNNSNISSQATLAANNSNNEGDKAAESSVSNSRMPIRRAAERLLEQGFEPEKVDKVLEEASKDGMVNYDKAFKKLKKTRLLQERLMRLDRMG